MRTLQLINLWGQLALAIGVGVAYILIRRRHLTIHCFLMRVFVPLQVLATAGFMFRSLLGYVQSPPNLFLLVPEMVLHHSLGMVVILVFIWVNLGFTWGRRYRRALKPLMRTAIICWAITLLLGLHIFLRVGI
jgi:hypothetical protein